MQTHIAENRAEIAWIKELFPDRRGLSRRLRSPRAVRPARRVRPWHLAERGRSCSACTIAARRSRTARPPTSSSAAARFDLGRAQSRSGRCGSGLGTDIGAGTSFSILATLGEAYKAAQLNRQSLSAGHAYYLATRGSARAMYLDDRIGSIAPGMEADLVVLDMRSTPLDRLPHERRPGLRRAALHPDDAGRRPRRAGHLCRRPAGPRPGARSRLQPPFLV